MIDGADFLKWLEIFGVPYGGGAGGDVTKQEVQQLAFNYQPATGVNDAFVVNLSPAVTSLTNGLLVSMNAATLTNLTTTPTLKVNALAPVQITTFAGVVAPGDIQPGLAYLFMYNTQYNEFQLINPSKTSADTFLVQNMGYNYAIDSGVANAYIANVTPVQPSIQDAFTVWMLASHANTSASTITINGTTKNIVQGNNVALSGGEIVANQLCFLVYNASYDHFVLMNPASPLTGAVLLAPSGNQTIAGNFTLQAYNLTATNNLIGGNLQLNGNTISSTNTNGNISFIPNGSGYILFGTTTPPLAEHALQQVGLGTNSGFYGVSYANDTSHWPRYYGYKSRSTTQGTFVPVHPGDVITNFSAWGDDGTQFSLCAGISIVVDQLGTVGTGIVPGRIAFSTVNNAGAQLVAGYFDYLQNLILTNPLGTAYGGTGTNALGTGVATAFTQAVSGSGGMALTGNLINDSSNIVLTFATPGDLVITPSIVTGYYVKIGSIVIYNYYLNFTPTYTTASGEFRVTIGLTANATITNNIGNAWTNGMSWPASTTQLSSQMQGGMNYFRFLASGSGVAAALLTTTQLQSGVNRLISGTITFIV
jgi:hypothetical protein